MKTPKNLYGKKKKHICWVMAAIKFFFHLNSHYHSHPTKKNHPWYQVCSSGINNNDTSQCVNAINQKNNVDPPTRKLKKKQRKNVGLLSQDMKPYISRNKHKNIPNDIIGCDPLPTMGTMEEVNPHGVSWLVTNVMYQTKRWERPNLICNTEKQNM